MAQDLKYLQNKTFWGDLKLVILGLWATVTGAISRRHLTDNLTPWLMLGIDVGCCLLSLTLASVVRFEGYITRTRAERQVLMQLLPLAVLCRVPMFYYFGFYRTLIRYFSLPDIKMIFDGVLLGSGVFVVIVF